jgi:hypothetical protein
LILDNVSATDRGRLPQIDAPDVVAATALTTNLLGTVTTAAAAAPRRLGWPNAAEYDGDADALSAKAMYVANGW